MSNTIDIEDIHNYLTMWVDESTWTDINMAIDSGFTDLAAKLLVEAGAIDSRYCYDDAVSIEKAIERLVKKYTNKQYKQDIKDCFGDAEVYINPDTNEHAFTKNKYVDYLMTEKEMNEMGFIKS